MSTKMRQRRRHDRAKRVITHRRENALFFARGTIPASALAVSMCSCGAAAFSRDPYGRGLDDFNDAHAYCDEVAA